MPWPANTGPNNGIACPYDFTEYTNFGAPIAFDQPCRGFEIVTSSGETADVTWTLVDGTSTKEMTDLPVGRIDLFQARGIASVTNATKIRVYY